MKKLLILAFLLLGCFSMASYAAKPKAKHVVYIGLDGWGSYSMPKANMPTVKSLMETGCYTMQKRTVLPSSSAVNWASMFMGFVISAVLAVLFYQFLPFSQEIRRTLAILMFGPVSALGVPYTSMLEGDVNLASAVNSASIILGIVSLTAAIIVFQ